jgi:GNAT superfamily N-acetyltransferase
VASPEPAWVDRILPFLDHKGALWLEPMRRAYTEGLDNLTINDFLGVLDSGEVVGNITTVECHGVAILQHVFTPPQHRRKGIATHLMRGLCGDFTSRGGRAMSLGTGYDTPPYHIYAGFGFHGRGDSGKMTWLPDADFPQTYFAPAPASIRETCWGDWPRLEALYATEGQWQLKGYWFHQFGHTGYESQYPELREAMDKGEVSQVKVMETPAGAVVGHAFLAGQPAWKNRVLVLDLMVHASFHDRLGELLATVEFPAGHKVQAFCDAGAEAKMAALEAAGFSREGLFSRQMEDENHQLVDVVVYGREG